MHVSQHLSAVNASRQALANDGTPDVTRTPTGVMIADRRIGSLVFSVLSRRMSPSPSIAAEWAVLRSPCLDLGGHNGEFWAFLSVYD